MAKPDKERRPDGKKGSPPEAAAWGTWEELLLAYAVNRFGVNSWDSVSSELRKRSSAQILLTPHHCEQKYKELQRRFAKTNGDDVDIDDGGETVSTAAVPWIEELRELRVAELQRELKNFDIYITSLQMKVKKLTEEDAKKGCGEKKKSDLGQKKEIETRNDEEAKYNLPDPVTSGEEQVPSGDESDRDDQSVNGSNGNLETGAEKSENENESSPVGTGNQKPESSPNSPTRIDDSCNGRPVGKEPVKTEPESKSEGAMRENSDVQSAASKSRKERSDSVQRGSSKAEELDNEDLSRDTIPVRSLPLIDILLKVRKLGSAVFERRLDRQEKLRYKNLVRQHIDFEILQTRLKEGRYSDGNNNFFRDLLLLVNNTLIFFSGESPPHVAATELRQFVLKEMTSKRKQKNNSKRAPEPRDSMKLTGPMIACRKRSSITAKEKVPASESQEAISEIMKKKKAEEKKQSAAKFLNRMKQGSAAAATNEQFGMADGGEKDQVAKRSSGGRQLKEPDSPTKRNVGRPPKRAAAAAALGKRSREREEYETSGSKQTKKKSKR